MHRGDKKRPDGSLSPNMYPRATARSDPPWEERALANIVDTVTDRDRVFTHLRFTGFLDIYQN